MTRQYYDWKGVVATARRRPYVWLALFPDHPVDLAVGIRRRRSAHLRHEDGRLEATIVNRYTIPGFCPRGDVWVRWVPTPTTNPKDAP